MLLTLLTLGMFGKTSFVSVLTYQRWLSFGTFRFVSRSQCTAVVSLMLPSFGIASELVLRSTFAPKPARNKTQPFMQNESNEYQRFYCRIAKRSVKYKIM